jgi:hypothetical protein
VRCAGIADSNGVLQQGLGHPDPPIVADRAGNRIRQGHPQ